MNSLAGNLLPVSVTGWFIDQVFAVAGYSGDLLRRDDYHAVSVKL